MPNRRARSSRAQYPLKPPPSVVATMAQWDEHRRILRELFDQEQAFKIEKGTVVFVLRKDRVWFAHRLKKYFVYFRKAFMPKFEDLISLEEAKDLQRARIGLLKTHNDEFPVIAFKKDPAMAFPLLYAESASMKGQM